MERHYRSNWRNGLEISVTIFQRKEKTMLYAGVDLGTSAVKLLLMDSEGKIRKISALFSASGLVGAKTGGLV